MHTLYLTNILLNSRYRLNVPRTSLVKSRTIGIIGGAGPMAGVLLCEYIVQICQKKYDCTNDADFPELILYSFPFAQMLKEDPEEHKKVSEQLGRLLNDLSTYTDNIGIACNTLHGFVGDDNQARIVNLVSLTNSYLQTNSILNPLVVGTSTSFKRRVHQFKNCIHPNSEQQIEVDRIIDEVLSGKVTALEKSRLYDVIRKALNEDIDAVILGCTELSVLCKGELLELGSSFNVSDINIECIDPLVILAHELCDRAMG